MKISGPSLAIRPPDPPVPDRQLRARAREPERRLAVARLVPIVSRRMRAAVGRRPPPVQ